MIELRDIESRIILLQICFLSITLGLCAVLVYTGFISLTFLWSKIGALVLATAKIPVLRLKTKNEKVRIVILRLIEILIVTIFIYFNRIDGFYYMLYISIILISGILYGSKLCFYTILLCGLSYLTIFSMGLTNGLPLVDSNTKILFNLLAMLFIVSIAIVLSLEYDKKKAETQEASEILKRSIAELYTLQNIDNILNAVLSVNELLNVVNDMILGIIGSQYNSIMICNEEENIINIAATNIQDETMQRNLLENSEYIWKYINDKKKIINQDSIGHSVKNLLGKSIICVPLMIKGKLNGFIIAQHKVEGIFKARHNDLLSIIAAHISMAMENTQLYQKLRKMAITDGLTSINNRRYFEYLLEKEIKNTINGDTLCLTICDIDCFKNVNDSHGHVFGDRVLKNITMVIKDSIRVEDAIFRYGGEEFVIILPKTDMEDAYMVIERLRKKIESHEIQEDNISVGVTISFGIACYPQNSDNVEGLIKAADDALYMAKNQGRNQTRTANDVG